MAPCRTAVMIFTAILDLEARRKAKEASKAGRRKIRRMRQFSRTLHRPFLGLFCPVRVSYCAWCLTHVVRPLHSIKRSKVWFPQTTTCPPSCSITHFNYFKQPLGKFRDLSYAMSYGVIVSTLDFESSDPSSNLGWT